MKIFKFSVPTKVLREGSVVPSMQEKKSWVEDHAQVTEVVG